MCLVSSVDIVQGLLETPVVLLWCSDAVHLPWHLYFICMEVSGMCGKRGELDACTAEYRDLYFKKSLNSVKRQHKQTKPQCSTIAHVGIVPLDLG